MQVKLCQPRTTFISPLPAHPGPSSMASRVRQWMQQRLHCTTADKWFFRCFFFFFFAVRPDESNGTNCAVLALTNEAILAIHHGRETHTTVRKHFITIITIIISTRVTKSAFRNTSTPGCYNQFCEEGQLAKMFRRTVWEKVASEKDVGVMTHV